MLDRYTTGPSNGAKYTKHADFRQAVLSARYVDVCPVLPHTRTWCDAQLTVELLFGER